MHTAMTEVVFVNIVPIAIRMKLIVHFVAVIRIAGTGRDGIIS
jgi:hypothetical protein